MRPTPAALSAWIALVASTLPVLVHASPAPSPVAAFEERYVAMSLRAQVDTPENPVEPGESRDNAAGTINCGVATPAGRPGGGCFLVGRFPAGWELHVIARDDAGQRVSLFAGFDLDGDGFLVPGPDAVWETDSGELSAMRVPGGDLFKVYVRAVSARADIATRDVSRGLATLGTLTMEVWEAGAGPCQRVGGGDAETCGQEKLYYMVEYYR